MKAQFRIQNSEFRIKYPASAPRYAILTSLLLTSVFWLLTPAIAATHVTGTYDLGQNPHVMVTVNGIPEYGLVFAQRNKQVTYGGVEYGPSVLKGYLNADGKLNDGAGNLWLDLIPNLGATPADSYYVVTFNIQGQAHAEIWVVPDLPTVSAEVCRQAQPPSATAPALFYQFLQQNGDGLPQRQKLNLSGSGVSCVDNAGQLRTDCTFSGGGGSVPKASATTSGTVKTDVTASDPVVYLTSSADSLLAGKADASHAHAESDVTNLVTDLAAKVPTSRSVSTTAPLAGGGALSADLTLSCPTCEVTGNKNTASGYAGLTSSTKLTASQGQEVWAAADLSDLSGLFGTSPGTKAVTTALAGDPAADNCVKWLAGGKVGDAGAACGSGGGSHNLLSATHSDTTPASAVRGDGIFAIGTTPTWQRLAHPTVTGGYFKWNGTDIVASSLAASGTGSCTNQVVTAVNADAAPSCNTVTSAYTSGTFPPNTEALALGDLSDFTAKSGTGTTGIGATFTSLTANDIPKWNGSNWVNAAAASKADALTNDPSDCSTNQYATAIAASGNLTCSQPASSNLSDGANVVKNNQANTYSGGGLQDLSAQKLALPAATTLPGTCTANKEVYVDTDATPAGQQVYLCNASGNGWNLIGDGGGGGGDNISVNGTAATDADFDDSTPGAPANAINVKWQKDAATPNNLSAYVPYQAPLTVTGGNLDCQDASGAQKGCLTSANWTTFNGKPNLVTAGTAGSGPSKVGDATTAARSNHDHRSIHSVTWFFPGTPATGVQNMTLALPEGIVNPAITDMRATVNTTSASSSTFNLQRCTANCTGTSPTFANIYSTNLTLNANTRTAAKAAAPDQNVTGLAAGDQFKANLVSIGASLADVTVTMTVKYDTTN